MSMISPESYIEELQNKTYKELLEVRDELLDEIREFEENFEEIMGKEPDISPSPDVVYQWTLDALGILFKLISDKFNEEYE